MNEHDVAKEMKRLLLCTKSEGQGFSIHGAWQQCRDDYYYLFSRMMESGLVVAEDRILDLILASDSLFLNENRGANERWQNDVRKAWNEWRFVTEKHKGALK
jgi:hypothetical protein